jgi:hypothetical protein
VRYTPRATSRYREYFPQDQNLDFTRAGEEIEVDVPASARPLAPQIAYVVPMYQWQRKTDTNVRRSVRFGGGLRIFLERPWYSSGDGELLGVCVLSPQAGFIQEPQREKGLGQVVTQWGRDPIWLGGAIGNAPLREAFALRVADEAAVRTYERASGEPPSPMAVRQPYVVAVAGHEVAYDAERKLWFCDMVINTEASAYAPFVRLALARYQPHALPDAKISPIVLADFAQLSPVRSVSMIRHQPTRLRLSVAGPAPRSQGRIGTGVEIAVQERDTTLQSDLAWTAAIGVQIQADLPAVSPLVRWSGEIRFSSPPEPGRYRVVIREYETFEPGTRLGRPVIGQAGKRVVYLEILDV